MSRRNSLLKYPVITNGNAASAITSLVTNIQYLDDIGVQFNFPGTASGSFQVQVSADYAQDASGNVTNAGNWIPLTFTYFNGSIFVTATSIPASVGSSIYLDLALLSAPWIRTTYSGGGTGLINAFITAKGSA